MPGPLPKANARRRNAPTIPTTVLPPEGRKGRAPKVPEWVTLEKAGMAWWRWAWKTPQAAGWASGHEVAVARRARLEDAEQNVTTWREMRELDDRLGLTPKGMAALRWSIGEPEAKLAPVADVADYRAALSA